MFSPWIGKVPWESECLLNPVLLPGELHGQRNLTRLHFTGSQKVEHDCMTNTFTFFFHTYIHFLGGFFSHTGHYRVLSRAPCDTQLVLISYLFYI